MYDSALQIYLRAARLFLGVPKNTSTHGIISELNQLLPQSRGQIRMIRQFYRLLNMTDANDCKKVFIWDKNLNEANVVNTWYNEVNHIFTVNGLGYVLQNGFFDVQNTIKTLKTNMLKKQQIKIEADCNEKPKLRTFAFNSKVLQQPPHTC